MRIAHGNHQESAGGRTEEQFYFFPRAKDHRR